VAKMDAGLQQLFHRNFNCQLSSSGDRCFPAPAAAFRKRTGAEHPIPAGSNWNRTRMPAPCRP
jgi:hypothetical protein